MIRISVVLLLFLGLLGVGAMDQSAFAESRRDARVQTFKDMARTAVQSGVKVHLSKDKVEFQGDSGSVTQDIVKIRLQVPDFKDFAITGIQPGPDFGIVSTDGKKVPVGTYFRSLKTPQGTDKEGFVRKDIEEEAFLLYIVGEPPTAYLSHFDGNLILRVASNEKSLQVPLSKQKLLVHQAGKSVPRWTGKWTSESSQEVDVQWMMWDMNHCPTEADPVEGACIERKTRKKVKAERQFSFSARIAGTQARSWAMLDGKGNVVDPYVDHTFGSDGSPHKASDRGIYREGYRPVSDSLDIRRVPGKNAFADHRVDIRYWSQQHTQPVSLSHLDLYKVEYRRGTIQFTSPDGKQRIGPERVVWSKWTYDAFGHQIVEESYEGKTHVRNRMTRKRSWSSQFNLTNDQGLYAGTVTFSGDPDDVSQAPSWQTELRMADGSASIRSSVKRSRLTLKNDIEMRDQAGNLAARARGTFKIITEEAFLAGIKDLRQ